MFTILLLTHGNEGRQLARRFELVGAIPYAAVVMRQADGGTRHVGQAELQHPVKIAIARLGLVQELGHTLQGVGFSPATRVFRIWCQRTYLATKDTVLCLIILIIIK